MSLFGTQAEDSFAMERSSATGAAPETLAPDEKR
jgi:hypothetical protein